MSNYYYDCEFLEGVQRKDKSYLFGLLKSEGYTKPTIDLISIGIVSEDNREYYAISKDFNLEEAWNRYDVKTEIMSGDARNTYPNGRSYRQYWIRDNVLKPIFKELWYEKGHLQNLHHVSNDFTYSNLKRLILLYGKSNKQIAEEIIQYTNGSLIANLDRTATIKSITTKPVFYGYYSAYDHVALCWLFGKMIDLPNGFPMYTIDLQQIKEEIEDKYREKGIDFSLSEDSEYPQQEIEHHSLEDAKWTRDLHNFLKTKRK